MSQDRERVEDQGSDDALLPIVGVGASAGGLAAFSELLHHLPVDTGMAFVLVQHLDPGQESLLSELLGRTTQIPVTTAEDGMVVEANHVYVIPPNTQMTIAQRRLQLAACDQTQQRVKTVDLLLKSLASDQQNKAIAIILSGSNNDGAAGIPAVRAAGGITFAQTPATAEFPDMPNAAIATGQVDLVLSPAKIAEELVNISRHPYLCESASTQSNEEPSVFQESDLSTIFRLLQKKPVLTLPTTNLRRFSGGCGDAWPCISCRSWPTMFSTCKRLRPKSMPCTGMS